MDVNLLLHRLGEIRSAVSTIAEDTDNNDQKYTEASLQLIGREYDRLRIGIADSDLVVIRFSLRSIADMPKGLIDIGADWTGDRKPISNRINQLATDCHQQEVSMRTDSE